MGQTTLDSLFIIRIGLSPGLDFRRATVATQWSVPVRGHRLL